MLLYWLLMCRKTRHGIIGGHLFVALENMNRIIPYTAVAAVALFMLVIFCKKKKKALQNIGINNSCRFLNAGCGSVILLYQCNCRWKKY